MLEQVLSNLAQAAVISIVLAFFIETALGYLFGMSLFNKLHGKGVKAPISFVVCYLICHSSGFDFILIVFGADSMPWLSQGITALFLAGGSKSISLRFGELKRTLDSVNMTR